MHSWEQPLRVAECFIFLFPLLHNQDVTSALTAQVCEVDSSPRRPPGIHGRGGRFLPVKPAPGQDLNICAPFLRLPGIETAPGDAADTSSAFPPTETGASEQLSHFLR